MLSIESIIRDCDADEQFCEFCAVRKWCKGEAEEEEGV